LAITGSIIGQKVMKLDENEKKLAKMLAHLGDEVHLLTSLLEGGHLKAEEAYYKVKELWRQTKKTKRELFPDSIKDQPDTDPD